MLPVKPSKQVFRNLILPALLLAPLLWLHVGCIYVPWFEQRENPSAKDFRGMVGAANSRKPVRPGAITRARIEAMFGPPPFLSLDGTAIGYDCLTHSRYWIIPLCFSEEPANETAYIVRFTFDTKGTLTHYDTASSDAYWDWIASMEPNLAENGAFKKLDRAGPQLHLAAMINAWRAASAATSKP